MTVRSRAPLRLGLAGGGTDVSPYSDEYGGAVLNATIDLYSHCTIEPRSDGQVVFDARDMDIRLAAPAEDLFEIRDRLVLHKAVHNRVVDEFMGGRPLPVTVTTFSEAPPGSGLGSSSAMVVSLLRAYQELLRLPLGEYDLAHLAFEIERLDCGLMGGKQDQYASTFGGVNFIEFYDDDRVIVNPLRIRRGILSELEESLVLYFTGVSRFSARIVEDQSKNAREGVADALQGLHEVKASAFRMKEMLLKADVRKMGELFREGWEAKKKTSSVISNPFVDRVVDVAVEAGAVAARLSGAGGGGFMMVFVEPTGRLEVESALRALDSDGRIYRCHFTRLGAQAWQVSEGPSE